MQEHPSSSHEDNGLIRRRINLTNKRIDLSLDYCFILVLIMFCKYGCCAALYINEIKVYFTIYNTRNLFKNELDVRI